MTASPKVLINNLDPCLRAICVEVDRKRSIGRKALRDPPSSSTRDSRSSKIWKDSNARDFKDHTEVRLQHALDGIAHGRDSLNSNQ